MAGFCRTLPCVGTPIERKLREEGRLIGPPLDAEYRFLDPRVDLVWDFALMAFEGRNFGSQATWNLLRGCPAGDATRTAPLPRGPWSGRRTV